MDASRIASQTNRLLSMHGDDFSVERNNSIIATTKGFFCSKDYPNTIQLTSNSNVLENDWLIHNSTNRKYFVRSVKPLSKSNQVLGWMAEYLSEVEYKKSISEKDKSTFSIGAIYGSAIVGNYNNATINNGYNLSEIRSLISSKPIEDQEELNKLIDRIEIITEDNQPVSKGTLAKFSDLLAKHSDIAISLGSSIMNWLTTR
ncbi:hypothetical protein [Clostridium beijerinckii]|uniref:hypothetical protein n=1 Tax=Clostridium beijerinckii TaxID=1520 RepID=UPI0003D32C35|nr:hypothetical protein [Clostridium beijerinckii]ALB46245.1 hypothetical protein X276_13875 [Clostridium beijerinckii NRRL B-598]